MSKSKDERIDHRSIMRAEEIRKVAHRHRGAMSPAERDAAIKSVEDSAKAALKRMEGRG